MGIRIGRELDKVKMNIVHIGGDAMNTVVTSKEEILKKSRELIQENGWASVNIRSVAAACGVSVGSIYNYFESKSALVSRPPHEPRLFSSAMTM